MTIIGQPSDARHENSRGTTYARIREFADRLCRPPCTRAICVGSRGNDVTCMDTFKFALAAEGVNVHAEGFDASGAGDTGSET